MMKDEPALVDLMRAHPRKSLRAFCETYLEEWFPHSWWSSQISLIHDLEHVVLGGRSIEREVERGKGATTLIMAASVWMMSYGHFRRNTRRRRIALIHDTSEVSQRIASQIADLVDRSPALQRDFGLAYIGRYGADSIFGSPAGKCSVLAGSLHGGRMGIHPSVQFVDNAVNYDQPPRLVALLEKTLSSSFHGYPTLAVRSVKTLES